MTLAQAICSGCGKRSAPRIIGTAPKGWKRFVNPRDDAVTYICPDCPDYLEIAVSIANRDTARYRLLRDAIQQHIDTFGYDNHEGLADALAAAAEIR